MEEKEIPRNSPLQDSCRLNNALKSIRSLLLFEQKGPRTETEPHAQLRCSASTAADSRAGVKSLNLIRSGGAHSRPERTNPHLLFFFDCFHYIRVVWWMWHLTNSLTIRTVLKEFHIAYSLWTYVHISILHTINPLGQTFQFYIM